MARREALPFARASREGGTPALSSAWRSQALSDADKRLPYFACAVALGAVVILHTQPFYHDDAYITLRYVRNLLSGKGLAWNPGERVEGFTHPLWLAQVALLGSLGIDLKVASRLLGCLYFTAMYVLWWRVRAFAPLLLTVVTLPGLVLWVWGGLETVSFSF